MFGVNYRYELNPEKGTIKLAPTRKFIVTTLLVNVAPVVALFAYGSYLEKKEEREIAKNVENTPEED